MYSDDDPHEIARGPEDDAVHQATREAHLISSRYNGTDHCLGHEGSNSARAMNASGRAKHMRAITHHHEAARSHEAYAARFARHPHPNGPEFHALHEAWHGQAAVAHRTAMILHRDRALEKGIDGASQLPEFMFRIREVSRAD